MNVQVRFNYLRRVSSVRSGNVSIFVSFGFTKWWKLEICNHVVCVSTDWGTIRSGRSFFRWLFVMYHRETHSALAFCIHVLFNLIYSLFSLLLLFFAHKHIHTHAGAQLCLLAQPAHCGGRFRNKHMRAPRQHFCTFNIFIIIYLLLFCILCETTTTTQNSILLIVQERRILPICLYVVYYH